MLKITKTPHLPILVVGFWPPLSFGFSRPSPQAWSCPAKTTVQLFYGADPQCAIGWNFSHTKSQKRSRLQKDDNCFWCESSLVQALNVSTYYNNVFECLGWVPACPTDPILSDACTSTANPWVLSPVESSRPKHFTQLWHAPVLVFTSCILYMYIKYRYIFLHNIHVYSV